MAAYNGTHQGGGGVKVACLSDRWLCVKWTHEFGRVQLAPGWRLEEKLEKQVSMGK